MTTWRAKARLRGKRVRRGKTSICKFCKNICSGSVMECIHLLQATVILVDSDTHEVNVFLEPLRLKCKILLHNLTYKPWVRFKKNICAFRIF